MYFLHMYEILIGDFLAFPCMSLFILQLWWTNEHAKVAGTLEKEEQINKSYLHSVISRTFGEAAYNFVQIVC